MKMWENHLAFLVKKQWWKILLIYILVMMFNMNIQEITNDVTSVFDEMAVFSWMISAFVIFIYTQMIQKQLYDTWLRFKLLPGNKLSLILADIMFLCFVFGIWYIMFILEYKSNSYNQYFFNHINDFNSTIQQQPFMSLFYPNSISNVLRGILHILCVASLGEYCLLLNQRRVKKNCVISEVIWFLLVLGIVVFVPIYFVILIYVILTIYYIKKCKYHWNHMEIGG